MYSQRSLLFHWRARPFTTCRLNFARNQTTAVVYDWKSVEAKYQNKWREESNEKVTSKSLSSNNDFYVLSMFPYPSGNLHMGHVRVYTLSDCIAQFARLFGKSVIHPMGWDAFGLPAENAAMERGIDPREWTEQNIATMRQQLDSLGFRFDWEREVTTCKSDYYRWTQAIFVRLYEMGLVYRAEAAVNWDPVDKTVLANEQVDAEGRSWRSGAKVERRMMTQWFIKTTARAKELDSGIDQLTEWPSTVRALQKQWIGASQGTIVQFRLDSKDSSVPNDLLFIKAFTTRPETIFGVSFVAIAPSHPLVSLLSVEEQARAQHIAAESDLMNRGGRVESADHGFVTNLRAINPMTNESVPIVIGAYVLSDVGTGAVMGVPAHDSRDQLFAELEKLPVLSTIDEETNLMSRGYLKGRSASNAAKDVTHWLMSHNCGESTQTFRLRDWLISRQRFWGTPIPVVHCSTCGPIPLPEEELPVDPAPRDEAAFDTWLHSAKCPSCNGSATRECDTMDTFVDSSYYFLRYTDPHCTTAITRASQARAVDVYIGGIEHAVLHLLYARFIARVLHERGEAPSAEPFTKLVTQGMVVGQTFRSERDGRIIKREEVDSADPNQLSWNGEKVVCSYEKMSKSKHNGVDPRDIVKRHGADCTRLYVLFKAPIVSELAWDEEQVRGQLRFVSRIHRTVMTSVEIIENSKPSMDRTSIDLANDNSAKLLKNTLDVIESVAKDAERLQFNTAISALMTFTTQLSKSISTKNHPDNATLLAANRCLVILLSPFAPHIASDLWKILCSCGSNDSILWSGNFLDDDVLKQRMPDSAALRTLLSSRRSEPRETVLLFVHVAGKFRAKLVSESVSASDDELVAMALQEPKVLSAIQREKKLEQVPDEEEARKMVQSGVTRLQDKFVVHLNTKK